MKSKKILGLGLSITIYLLINQRSNLLSNILALALLLIFINPAWASPYKTVSINAKTSDSGISIQYPQGFASKLINLKIQTFIDRLKEPYLGNAPLQNVPEDEWVGEGGVDGDFIIVTFKIKSNTPHILSILFNIQTYGRGAAHPNDSIQTLNFIDGQAIKLGHLFKPNSNYLSIVSSYCYNKLLKKFTGNEYKLESLKEGTEAVIKNYNTWYLNKKGLVIVFEDTQISPFANGPESYVTIPYTTMKSWDCAKKENMIWDNT